MTVKSDKEKQKLEVILKTGYNYNKIKGFKKTTKKRTWERDANWKHMYLTKPKKNKYV